MIELAMKYGSGPVFMRSIAEKQQISRKYLHALLTSLRAAGLVRSVRGSGGGYVLSQSPSQIMLSDIIKALEGTISLVNCAEDKKACKRSHQCVAVDVWCQLTKQVDSFLSNISLEDLVHRQSEKHRTQGVYQYEI